MNASTTKKQDTIMKYVFWGLGLLTLLILIVIIGYIWS